MQTFTKIYNLTAQLKDVILTVTKCLYNMRFNAWFSRVMPFSQGKFHAPSQGLPDYIVVASSISTECVVPRCLGFGDCPRPSSL